MVKKKKKNKMSVTELSSLGGRAVKKKYGSEHFAEIGRKGAEAKLKRDPEYFKKIRAIRTQKEIKRKKEEKKPVNQFVKLITGEEIAS